tara:strand:- start:655297 stop:658869 length:3573 start_codon:yes stop_codon:yes gene_type:complete
VTTLSETLVQGDLTIEENAVIDDRDVVNYLLHSANPVVLVDNYTSETFIQTSPETHVQGIPSDPSLDPASGYYQWHLTGDWGINADEVWSDYTGAGVRIAVMDDGFEYINSELIANYNTNIDFDTTGANDDDAFASASNNHGTAVAGIIAADDNGEGMVGVAFDSELAGIRLDFAGGVTAVIEGFNHALSIDADVMNNSWGYTATFSDNPNIPYGGATFADVENAMIDLVNLGRGGLGTSIVFSAGNSRGSDQDVNNHMLQNSPYTITVGGTDVNGGLYDATTKGAAVLTSSGAEGVWTVDKEGSAGYVSGDITGVSGTSFSAPTVSGVVGLMYEANADLGYRDVQEILALASRTANQTTFQTNGSTHWNGGGMHFSHDYGFGLIDTYAAVRLAETWGEQKTYANMQTVTQAIDTTGAIADNGVTDFTFTVSNDLSIEHIQLDLNLSHNKAGDLKITLISPDGTESYLVDTLDFGSYVTDPSGFAGINAPLTSVAHWGEHAQGTWTLRVEDVVSGNTGSINSANLTFMGSTVSADDTYFFTDEFVGGTTLTDSNGGVDTLNFAAVRGDITGNLDTQISVDGKVLTLNGTFENLITGDGNDVVTDNAQNNVIFTGRGDDVLTMGGGNDVIDGGVGNDTAIFQNAIQDYNFEILNATSFQISTSVGTTGTDTLDNFETFSFNGATYTASQLTDYINGLPPAAISIKFVTSDGFNKYHTSDADIAQTLTTANLNVAGTNEDVVGLTRANTSLSLQNLESAEAPGSFKLRSVQITHDSGSQLTLDNFYSNIITLNGNLASTVTITNASYGVITTGEGADTIHVTLNNLVVPATRDQVRVTANGGDDTITIDGTHSNFYANVRGGDGNDVINVVTMGDHYIYGDAGDDTITGSWGAETIEGGTGNDIIDGNRGNDIIYGGDGNDEIYGGIGNDYLYGDAGIDTIYGDANDDVIRGGLGNDTLYGGDGNDRVYGGDDNDVVYGDGGRDFLYGDAGDDTLHGGDWHDYLYGGDGADTLNGDAGNDNLLGQNGNDMLFGGDGYDKIQGGAGEDIIYGGSHNDKLFGQDDDDILYGDAGSDNLYGGYGNDILIGGEGVDYLYGNQGADTFHLDLVSQDRIKDFKISEGDVLDISDLLSGYGVGSDINDFVKITIQDQYRTDVQIDADGTGGFQYAGIIYGNFTGETVDGLISSGTFIVQ